jgi:ATP-dependent DNA helicase HFM1/MER3
VRIRKNPTHYELPANISREKLDSIIKEMCVGSLQQLAMNEVIDMTEDCSLRPRDLGRSMARYYVKFETVKRFQNVTEQSSFSDVIRTLCSAKEFEEYNFRLGEKKILNAINATKDKIRFQVKGRVKDLEDKIFVLLQVCLCFIINAIGCHD